MREWSEVAAARRTAARLAQDIGFSKKEIAEISIAVSELAENFIKHKAVCGKIICSHVEEGHMSGIQIVSEDRGPGIADVGRALRDGYSGGNTLGIGLGAVKRLMDEFDISSKAKRSTAASYGNDKEGIGTVVAARKWLAAQQSGRQAAKPATRFGYMCRLKKGEKHNGDGLFFRHFNGKDLIAVINGIGHGLYAEEAAGKACQCLSENFGKPLEVIITEMHDSLRKTRGAAVSIALIDKAAGRLDYVGIGNVLTRVFEAAPLSPANYNGIVGASLQKFKVFTYPWSKGNVLVMTSDGISEKYDLDRYPGLIGKDPVIIADIILRDYGRDHDDATVVVGKAMI